MRARNTGICPGKIIQLRPVVVRLRSEKTFKLTDPSFEFIKRMHLLRPGRILLGQVQGDRFQVTSADVAARIVSAASTIEDDYYKVTLRLASVVAGLPIDLKISPVPNWSTQYAAGKELQVRVLATDQQPLKAIVPQHWKKAPQQLLGAPVTATILSVRPYGLLILTDASTVGLLHHSEFQIPGLVLSDAFAPGEMIAVIVERNQNETHPYKFRPAEDTRNRALTQGARVAA